MRRLAPTSQRKASRPTTRRRLGTPAEVLMPAGALCPDGSSHSASDEVATVGKVKVVPPAVVG